MFWIPSSLARLSVSWMICASSMKIKFKRYEKKYGPTKLEF